jgi:hypothetical protein
MVNELKQSWGVLIEQAKVDGITGQAIVYSSPEFDSKPPFFADFSRQCIANQQVSWVVLVFL